MLFYFLCLICFMYTLLCSKNSFTSTITSEPIFLLWRSVCLFADNQNLLLIYLFDYCLIILTFLCYCFLGVCLVMYILDTNLNSFCWYPLLLHYFSPNLPLDFRILFAAMGLLYFNIKIFSSSFLIYSFHTFIVSFSLKRCFNLLPCPLFSFSHSSFIALHIPLTFYICSHLSCIFL